MSLRFSPAAAEAFRQAIADADRTEVFAIGEVRERQVVDVVVAARGTVDRVLAVFGRPRPGQVVLHDHPSGDLTPSAADLAVAARFSEDGVGFVITDADVRRDRWVVEPWTRTVVPIAPDAVRHTFTVGMRAAVAGWEPRPAQLTMAEQVRSALDGGKNLLVEAGTGTGKSLAYLVPAAHWALANETRVVISTRTRALQAQLLQSDLPLLTRAGLSLRAEVLEGRGQYLCRRRLGLATAEDSGDDDERTAALAQLATWVDGTGSGARRDLPDPIPWDVWASVQSDTDLTLATRCEHHARCCFYEARRRAADAHVIVVNHALLLADLSLRAESGRGVLPPYDRVILDEAHHLADDATRAAATGVTAVAIRRAISACLDRRRRRGALSRLAKAMEGSSLPEEVADRVALRTVKAADALQRAQRTVEAAFEALHAALDPAEPTRRLTPQDADHEDWKTVIGPALRTARQGVADALGALDPVMDALEGHRLSDDRVQPRLDLRRAIRRLSGHADALDRVLHLDDDERCRWIEVRNTPRGPVVGAHTAPVDVADWLERVVWRQVRGVVATSATLSIGGSYGFFRRRTGLRGGQESVLPSPFDHASQAILAMPTDIPEPDADGWLSASARVVCDAVHDSHGGAFVLCTSYAAVRAYTAALEAVAPAGVRILSQEKLDRASLVRRFLERPDSVLVGTDTLWEGVSIAGRALRLVVIPRLPFRVPHDPLEQARHERLAARGVDPFSAAMLPEAVLRLRQGYGRLIRTRADRGAVLILDPRLHRRRYGPRVLAALPPARRVRGPWSEIRRRVAAMTSPTG